MKNPILDTCSLERQSLIETAFARSVVLAVALIGLTVSVHAQEIDGCPVFPADSIWNVRVDSLPVDPNSSTYVATIGSSTILHADFGTEWEGAPVGIPFNTVPASQPDVPVSFLYPAESDPGPYPIPPDALIEGGPASDSDRHVLVIESGSCTLYELFSAYPQDGGSSWTAGSGAVFPLDSYTLRTDGWTSADAAGLPILPGLVRYDEVESGVIGHALRFTAPQTRKAYVWPARHHASDLTGTQYPPMGQRFRLRADFDVSSFSARMQVILQALKVYGMMLADNGAPWYISGVPDERWDDDELREFRSVFGSDFEAIDVSSLMLHPDSSQVAPGCTDVDQLSVTDIAVTDTQTFRACDQITVGPIVTVFGPAGYGHAIFSAGNRVVLYNGVSVLSGGRLAIHTGLPLEP